jgi:enoyl-CoA hydratase/carnithine racemase
MPSRSSCASSASTIAARETSIPTSTTGCGITRGLHRIYKPVTAALNAWTVGGSVELAMACDVPIAAEYVRIGSLELRRGMHPADGGIVPLEELYPALDAFVAKTLRNPGATWSPRSRRSSR